MIFDYTKNLQFESSKPLEESVESLSSKTHQSYWKLFLSGNVHDSLLMGSVKKEKVKLCRKRARIINSLTPFFYGKFAQYNGKVYLQGKFTMHPFVKIFLTVYLAVLFSFLLIGLIILFDSSSQSFGVIWLGGCLGLLVLLWIWKKLSFGNIEWISNEIKTALN